MSARLCTFDVGDLLIGIAVDQVQEVIHDPPVTPVPLADSSIAGLVNLRGQIVAAVDGRERLGLKPRPAGAEQSHVIVARGREFMSFIVDGEGDVLDVDPAACEAVPETVNERLRAMLSGAYKLDVGLLLELDAERALAVD